MQCKFFWTKWMKLNTWMKHEMKMNLIIRWNSSCDESHHIHEKWWNGQNWHYFKCYDHMNEIEKTTQTKFMTQNGINCMNEKIPFGWTWMVLFTLMDLDLMVELDHIAGVDDTWNINNHNTRMKLTNVWH